MATVTKLVHNSLRPDRMRLAELEKAADKMSLNIHRLEQSLERVNLKVESLEKAKKTTDNPNQKS